jgi:hypothetical protein
MMRTISQKWMHRISETARYAGTEINRQGVVDEVKEEGGERKFRCTIGYKPDGTPWRTPWMSSQEQRSSTHRTQAKIVKGQNVTIQGPSLRQATATPQAEAQHAPQPKHAPEVNGESQSIGKKLRSAYHGGKEEEQQQQGGGGGAGGGGGSSGGGQQQKEEKHYWGNWIDEEDEELPKWQPQSKGGGGGGGGQSGQQGQGQQGQKKESKRAMQVFMHEEEGHGQVIGEGDSAVRQAVSKKGTKMRAGKTYSTLEKDGKLVNYSEKEGVYLAKKQAYFQSEDSAIYCKGAPPCVNKPWVIKSKQPEKKDPLKNYDLGKKNGGGGG